MGGRAGPVERAPVRRSNTMPPNLGNAGILGKAVVEERVPGLDSICVSFVLLSCIILLLFCLFGFTPPVAFHCCFILFLHLLL